MINYPITFIPILKEKIWGGSKLQTLFGKQSTSNSVGESWEISGVKRSVSLVANGPEKNKSLQFLIEKYQHELVGKTVFDAFGSEFPLLIKYIDANKDLSVQVHPDDEIAKQRHNSFGKTEMWYIMQADEGARLNIGFKKSLTEAEYEKALTENQLMNLLHFQQVEKGDAVFIPPGKVHAIGAGVLLAEIQQTSDITYRIYDWDRVDAEGNARELHNEEAIVAIDFEKQDDYWLTYKKTPNHSNLIKICPFFQTNYLPVEGNVEKDYSLIDSFVIYMCVGGEATITTTGGSVQLSYGQTVLIPACCKQVRISAQKAELLEVYLPTFPVDRLA